MRTEQAVVTRVTPNGIVIEDDFGEVLQIQTHLVTGTPRVGATCTLVVARHDCDRIRAFIEPEEMPAQIATDPDESGVVMVSSRVSQLLKAVG